MFIRTNSTWNTKTHKDVDNTVFLFDDEHFQLFFSARYTVPNSERSFTTMRCFHDVYFVLGQYALRSDSRLYLVGILFDTFVDFSGHFFGRNWKYYYVFVSDEDDFCISQKLNTID